MTVYTFVLIFLSLNLYLVESKQPQVATSLETVIADRSKTCSERYKEELFINLTQHNLNSDDCYRAWKYGVSYISELEHFYSVLCQPNCKAALHIVEQECGFPEDAEYSMDQLRQVCARNEAGELCYSLAIEESSEMSRVYAECWDQVGDKNHCSAHCEEAIGMFLSSHGCCLNNLYNTTILTSHDTVLSQALPYNEDMAIVVDYSLWNSCGVEAPDVCRETLLLLVSSGGEKTHGLVTINITLGLIAAYSLIRNGAMVVV